jgi:hypothetical protein
MKHLKKYNESNEISRDELDNLIDPIRDDISDMLVDFVGYEIKFNPVNMLNSSVCFQLHIFRKGWPLAGYEDIAPILVDRDILDDLRRVCDFIKSEIGFDYVDSYYYYNLPKSDTRKWSKRLVRGSESGWREEDIFKSGRKKLVTSVSMFFSFTHNSL